MNAPHAAVTPALVECAIRQALAAGWRSEANGSPRLLAMVVAE